MIIQSADIAFSQRHELSQSQSTRTRMRLSTNTPSTPPQPPAATAPSVDPPQNTEQTLDFRLTLIKGILENMTGKSIALFQPRVSEENFLQQDTTAISPPTTPSQGFSLDYEQISRYEEQESLHFSAQGVVKTQDGQTIDIMIQLNMQRSFMTETQLRITAGDRPIDPLVINFNGTAAELTNRRFEFDLDADGKTEQIAFATANSGFLAHDINQDGVINDGRELFGATTGQGFAELAVHDQDGNGFIDEGDDIYHQLRIFSKDENGHSQLIALADSQVGAIYLNRISTPFALKTADNVEQGRVRETGLYLNQDGSIGSIQQVDLMA